MLLRVNKSHKVRLDPSKLSALHAGTDRHCWSEESLEPAPKRRNHIRVTTQPPLSASVPAPAAPRPQA